MRTVVRASLLDSVREIKMLYTEFNRATHQPAVPMDFSRLLTADDVLHELRVQ